MKVDSDRRREVGRRIQEWRQRLRWEQKELARRINGLDRRARCDGNMVSRWECGRNWPGRFYQELLCEVLAQADEDSFAGRVAGMDRRAFVREALGFGALTLLGTQGELPWDRISHALENPGRVDRRTIEGLERVRIGLEELSQQVRPTELIGPAVGHLDAITAMLRMPMPSGLRPLLCSVAAETAGLVAMIKGQAGHGQSSATYLRLSLQLAGEAGDRALGAWLMGRYTGSQLAYRDDPQLRLRHFTQGACGFAPSEASPRVRAWFAAKAADLHATLGQHDACLRALEQTEAVLRSARASGSVERPAHVPCGFDETWLLAERGACLSRLGQSEAARGALDTAMDRYGDAFGRGRLWLLLARARTFVHDEQPEEACRQATEVATQAHDVGFALVLHEIRRLHRSELAPWATTPAVRELGEQLAS